MSKQVQSAYVIIPTHEGYILPLQLLLGLPDLTMRPYTPEEWKILSHVVLTPNTNWYPSVPNVTTAEYSEYDEWFEQFDIWAGTA